MVSPGLGKRSQKVVRSMFALPTTAIRGILGIVRKPEDRFYSATKRQGEEGRVYSATRIVSTSLGLSFAVRHPNILHLGSMLQEPAAFALLHVKPVDHSAFVGEHLFEIPD